MRGLLAAVKSPTLRPAFCKQQIQDEFALQEHEEKSEPSIKNGRPNCKCKFSGPRARRKNNQHFLDRASIRHGESGDSANQPITNFSKRRTLFPKARKKEPEEGPNHERSQT